MLFCYSYNRTAVSDAMLWFMQRNEVKTIHNSLKAIKYYSNSTAAYRKAVKIIFVMNWILKRLLKEIEIDC